MLDTIEEAIADLQAGKVIIVVDDEDRENEGDFVASAQMVTPELINFMATHGRGLICAPVTQSRAKELHLTPMVSNNTDPMETAFTVSIDLRGHGVTTGISAEDRSKTIKALIDPDTQPWDLNKPGHIFPLVAKDGGVLRRVGHTEASIDFARLAGHEPVGVIVEIMNEDGTMARLPELRKIADKFDLKLVSIEDLVAYRMENDSLITKLEDFEVNTRFGEYRLRAYKQVNNEAIHMALSKGDVANEDNVLVRINSTTINNDILGLLTSDGHLKIDRMFERMNKEEAGVMVFINKHHDAQTTLQRLKNLQEDQENGDALPKLRMDPKDYGIGAQILNDLGVKTLRVMSNQQPDKPVQVSGYGLEITGYESF